MALVIIDQSPRALDIDYFAASRGLDQILAGVAVFVYCYQLEAFRLVDLAATTQSAHLEFLICGNEIPVMPRHIGYSMRWALQAVVRVTLVRVRLGREAVVLLRFRIGISAGIVD